MSDYDVTTVDTTFLPQMTTDQAVQVYKAMKEFISATLVDGRDYGVRTQMIYMRHAMTLDEIYDAHCGEEIPDGHLV